MKPNDTFTYNCFGQNYTCRMKPCRYENGNLAIRMVDAEDESPIAIPSVNPGQVLEDGHIAVKDYSENAGMLEFLKDKLRIVGEPIAFIPSGFVVIPVCPLTEEGKELFEGV